MTPSSPVVISRLGAHIQNPQTTAWQVGTLPAFEMARRWADPDRIQRVYPDQPGQPGRVADQLEDLALVTALANRLPVRQARSIHRAVLAGATIEEITRAVFEFPDLPRDGGDPHAERARLMHSRYGPCEVARHWHRWAVSAIGYPHTRPEFGQVEYPQVYAVLGPWLACPQLQRLVTQPWCDRCGQLPGKHDTTPGGLQ